MVLEDQIVRRVGWYGVERLVGWLGAELFFRPAFWTSFELGVGWVGWGDLFFCRKTADFLVETKTKNIGRKRKTLRSLAHRNMSCFKIQHLSNFFGFESGQYKI